MEYALIGTLLKIIVLAWALVETTLVLRSVGRRRPYLAWLLGSQCLMLVVAGAASVWYGWEQANVIMFLCDDSARVLNTWGARALNFAYVIAAATGAITSRKIRNGANFINMGRVILGVIVALVVVIVFAGGVLRWMALTQC